ncbi:hypothetical protein NDU88_001526 [Pleurodeles waltl]|uniref:Uncharacterized protein n=1 Tax=Pleurodeles waltl TaxID=8319 RepID=A0AAV7LZT6_PLEWA|nr:hypothetical protein NDU88_001526 [Pleurodeles waltl]
MSEAATGEIPQHALRPLQEAITRMQMITAPYPQLRRESAVGFWRPAGRAQANTDAFGAAVWRGQWFCMQRRDLRASQCCVTAINSECKAIHHYDESPLTILTRRESQLQWVLDLPLLQVSGEQPRNVTGR